MTHRPRTILLTDAGVVIIAAAAVFTTRLVLERTVVAWRHGSPAINVTCFAAGLDRVGGILVGLSVLWTCVMLALTACGKLRAARTEWILVAAACACCGLWTISEESWAVFMVRMHGAGSVSRSRALTAAAAGETRLLTALLEAGVAVDARSRQGESALGAAAAAGRIDVAGLLIARGANIENRTLITRQTPLTEAAQMNRTDMVRFLLDRGADPDARDVMERTPLDWAIRNGNLDIVAMLDARADRSGRITASTAHPR